MKYKLYDLEIITKGDPKSFNCSHKLGDGLIVRGENIMLKSGTAQFSHYVLASLMPYVAAKQRVTDNRDWMYYETDIRCPDPNCGAIFSFKKLRQRTHQYSPID